MKTTNRKGKLILKIIVILMNRKGRLALVNNYSANKGKLKAYFCEYYDSHRIKERPPLINIMMLTRMT